MSEDKFKNFKNKYCQDCKIKDKCEIGLTQTIDKKIKCVLRNIIE